MTHRFLILKYKFDLDISACSLTAFFSNNLRGGKGGGRELTQLLHHVQLPLPPLPPAP